MIRTFTSDPLRLGAALDRIERRRQRQSARKARWRALRERFASLFRPTPGLPE